MFVLFVALAERLYRTISTNTVMVRPMVRAASEATETAREICLVIIEVWKGWLGGEMLN